jgi:hypothetical protein
MLAFHQPVYKSIINEEIEMPKNKYSAQKFPKQNVLKKNFTVYTGGGGRWSFFVSGSCL